jgi:uncharacterized protein (DUF1499 family)
MPKWAILTAVGAVTVLATCTWQGWPVINVVETGRTPEYPDLQPKQYQARKDLVFEAALRAIGLIPRWTVVSSRLEQGEIRAEARTRLFRFVDDVVIRVTAEGGAAIVNVRSASRIGKGDFGQNARNVRAFFAELDRQMEAGAHSGAATR